MPNELKDSIAYKILEERQAHKFISDIDQIVKNITPLLNEICNSFEELMIQTYNSNQYINIPEFDLEELIEDFENYGFKIFMSNFDKYKEIAQENWKIDSMYSSNSELICIFWDTSLTDDFMQNVLHRTKMHYLQDIGVLSQDFSEDNSYIANYSSDRYQQFEPHQFIVESPSRMTSYESFICYRGVLLNDVDSLIPHIANILTYVRINANIVRDDFIPSVTRRGLTDEQEQILSYAIGRAIHLYLLDSFSDDEDIANAMKKLIKAKYSTYNLLCK